MTARDFAYWLQGFFEIQKPTTIGADQTEMIARHLALVFKHEIDPSIDGGDPAVAEALNHVHNGGSLPPQGAIYRC
jgi:hypothetical protein